MKILLISPLYPTDRNPGLGIFVKRIESIYRELGYEVDLVSYGSGKNFWEKMTSLRRFLKTIRSKVKAGDHDLVNVQYPFLAPLAFVRLKLTKPLVSTLHGTDAKPDSLIKKVLLPWTGRLLRRSNLILVNSNFYKDFVMDRYRLTDQVVQLCPAGGYDPAVFYPPSKRGGEEVRWLGFAGRMTEKKGWRLALEAYEHLLAGTPALVGLKLAGQGEDMADLRQAVQRIEEAYPQARIQVLGNLNDSSLADFYRSLDLFVFPTLYEESLGLVAIESLASGCPLVASDKGAVGDYVQEGLNGYLVQAGKAEALTEAIVTFLNLSPDEEAAMRQAALASVASYSRDQVKVCIQEALEALARLDD